MEQISDWLTKAIVGIGLVEAKTILEQIDKGAAFIALFVGGKGSEAAVIVVGCLFVVIGFLGSFLWTRMYLTDQFRKADDLIMDTPEYYEGLMHAYLYQEPSGYKETLRVAEDYEATIGKDYSGRMCLYVACAYAQKYTDDLLSGMSKQDLEATKKNVLEYVKRAVVKGEENRGLIIDLWKPAEGDDPSGDFVVFRSDPDFARAVEVTRATLGAQATDSAI